MAHGILANSLGAGGALIGLCGSATLDLSMAREYAGDNLFECRKQVHDLCDGNRHPDHMIVHPRRH